MFRRPQHAPRLCPGWAATRCAAQTAPSSPSWHRRKRRARGAARQLLHGASKCRVGSCAGIAPSRAISSASALLTSHHGIRPLRLFVDAPFAMGQRKPKSGRASGAAGRIQTATALATGATRVPRWPTLPQRSSLRSSRCSSLSRSARAMLPRSLTSQPRRRVFGSTRRTTSQVGGRTPLRLMLRRLRSPRLPPTPTPPLPMTISRI